MSPSAVRSTFVLALTLALAAGGCHDSSGEPLSLPPGATNLGIESQRVHFADGVIAAEVRERGVDLNGNGEVFDSLLDVLALANGRRTRVPFVEVFSSVTVGGGFVSFGVPESAAREDLNRDGDQDDIVLHVLDARRGETRNLELALAFSSGGLQLAQDGALIAVGVSESAQGTDLDGDGLLDSAQAYAYEADRRRLTRLGLGLAPWDPRVSGRRIALVAEESTEGDLNGDGDLDDQVLHVHDVDTGTTTNLLRSVDRVELDGSTLVFESCECDFQGSPDLNGNGFAGDSFVELYDLETGLGRVTQESSAGIWLGGDLALLRLEETLGATELSVYDRFTDALFELGPLAFVFDEPAFADRRATFSLDELAAGQDLNGDGELLDTVLHAFDARTGLVRSSGRATFSPAKIDGTWAAFLSLSGPTALRPPPDHAVVVQDLQSGDVLDLGLLARDFRFANGRIVALTPEEWVGEDLNGDQDLLDSVVQVHDLATGVTTSTGLALLVTDVPIELHLDGDVLVLAVPEFDQGVDLNGDRDLDDVVLHAVRLH